MELQGASLVVVTVVVIVAFTGVLIWYSARRKGKTWKGSVAKVRAYQERRQPDEPPRDMVDVHCRTDTGRRVRLSMEQSQYDGVYPGGLVAGDRVEKTAGDWWPKKVTKQTG